jgi:hypothetical protein
VPEHLQVQLVGDTAAVVTFEMTNPERVARRTLVLQKRGDRWLVAHLHASNVALEHHSSHQSLKPTASRSE